MNKRTSKRTRAVTRGKKHRSVEVRWSPESEQRLRERIVSPEGQRLLDALAMVFAKVAVDRMLCDES